MPARFGYRSRTICRRMPRSAPTESVLSLRQSLIRGFAGVGVTRILQMLVSLLVSVLLARVLGPENFGRYTFVLAVIGLGALPAYAGFAPLLVREVARYDSGSNDAQKWPWIAAIWTWSLRLTVLVASVGGLLTGLYFVLFSGMGSFNPLLIALLGFCVVPVALTRIGAALLQGLRRVVVATLPETTVRPMVLLLLLVGLFSVGLLDTVNALLCFVAATLCACGYTGLLLRDVRSRIKNQTINQATNQIGADPVSRQQEQRRWRKALAPFSGIAAVGYLNTELLVPLVALFADSAEVAYFKIALSLALLVSMPLTLVESVIKPQVTRLFEASDGRRLQALISRSGWGALGLSLPVLLLFGLFGEQIVEVAFGEAFTAATRPMIILAVGFGVVNLVGPSMQLLYATRYENDALVISLLSLAGVIMASVAMIPAYGAVGAATAFAIAKVFRAVAFRFWASRRLHTLFNASSQ